MGDSQTVNLIDYLSVLRRRVWIIVLLAAVGVVVVITGGILDYLRHKPNKTTVSLEMDGSNSDLMSDLIQYVKTDGTLSVLKPDFGLTEEEFRDRIDVRMDGNSLILEYSEDSLPDGVLNGLGEAARGRYYQLRNARIEGEIERVKEDLANVGHNINRINQGLDELKSASSEERILMLGYMNTLIKLQDRRDLLENKLVELEGLKKANVKVVDSSGFVAQTVKKTAIRILSALVASFISGEL